MKYDKHKLINSAKTFSRDDFVFFWGHTDTNENVGKSCLSQWHMCSFTLDDVSYNCAEQFMMAEKARIFDNEDIWQQIMASYDPMTIKKLGRKVRNFNEYVWKKNCQEIVKRGNLAKFSQNPKLMEYLLGTGDKILVEASPNDTIWGIGLAEDAPEVCNPHLWQGENLLGFTLMEVRDMLRGKIEETEGNMEKALLMWTMGAGNSARRFNFEDPMPKKTKVAESMGNPLDIYVSVPQDFYLTSRQMDII
ncbi:MAG: NADAR family protein, partial [Muribaculaceae bacterium]